VSFTAAGQAAADALRAAAPQDSPRNRCEVTSVLFDWVFDGPVNRITQGKDEIILEYGRGMRRTVHMNIGSHAPGATRSRAGHSIGHWEGDTLVVDTIALAAGILSGTVPHSDRLHVVERFRLDPQTLALRRDYSAEDPVYFTDRYAGSDTVLLADAAFAADRCEELTYRNYSREAQN
jgi:hypothetical protein